MWERVKPFITEIEITKDNNHRVGVGYGLEGLWKPQGLNYCWRLCKYLPGGHFAPHYDGNFVKNSQVRSMKTFMLYLNDKFEGGTTNFVDEKQELWKDEKTGIFRAKDENILLKIKPEPGMAIVFNHELLHEGGQIHSGLKYIMRTDLMFEKASSNKVLDPKETEALLLLQEAEELECSKKPMEAAEKYRRAFKLWPPLADAYKS